MADPTPSDEALRERADRTLLEFCHHADRGAMDGIERHQCPECLVEEFRAVRDEARRAEMDRAEKCVQDELDKLGGRWSLDSAYLRQAIDAIRARGARDADTE